MVPRDAAEDRSWVGLVAQAGIAALRRVVPRPRAAGPRVAADVFGAAPRELAGRSPCSRPSSWCGSRSRSSRTHVDELAAPGRRAPSCARRCSRYSREVAFATAEVYARAAEVRGAWDARLEALVVDAVLRGEADEACGPAPRRWAGASAARSPWSSGDAPDAAPRRRSLDGVQRAARPPAWTRSAPSRATGWSSCSAGSTDPLRGGAALSSGSSAPGPVVVGPVGRRPRRRARVSAAAALSGLRAAAAWPDAPRPVRADDLLPERALAGDGHARRQLVEEVYAAAAPTPAATCSRPDGATSSAAGLDRGRGAGAVRAPEHRALPAAPGRRRSPGSRPPTPAGAFTLRSRWCSAGSARLADPPQRPICRNPTRSAPQLRRAPIPRRGPGVGHGGGVLAIVAPGQGAQTPGFLAPWLEDPTFADRLEWLSAVAGLDLAHYGTEADAETIRDTAVAQPLLVAAGLVAALELFPHPADAFGQVGVGAGHSVGELDRRRRRPGRSPPSRRWCWSASAAARWPRPPPSTPTGMTAVLGGDRDEVLATLDEHGLTAANDNGPGQIVAAGTLEQLAALADDPPAGRAADPAAGRRRVPHRAHGARRRAPRAASPARSRTHDPRTRLISNRDGAGRPRRPRGARADRRPGRAARSAGTCAWRRWPTSASPGCSRCRPAGTLTGIAKRGAPGRRDVRPQDARPARRRPRLRRASTAAATPIGDHPDLADARLARPRAPSTGPTRGDAGDVLEPGSAGRRRREPARPAARSSPRTAARSSSGSSRTATSVSPGQPLVRLHPEAVPA